MNRRADALPLNAITLGGAVFLRVTLAGGALLHLAPQTTALPVKRARAALEPRHRPRLNDVVHYDGSALAERIWSRRTLCRLSWSQMAGQAHETELAAQAASAGRGGYACPWCAREALRWAA